ncbi:hypothetical protein [Azohydromonas caseinilytica]|uniref:Uncharacterized protein n=1 Tax=Azohydromonas caseinilytica TaxID=2728836 RepID=A0A848F6Z9_9BURK|nr:hypothetical protein [Azohydromonas caseinilytica]NML14339.1 hypothetical protein [Azohydromonas caseinilytica]
MNQKPTPTLFQKLKLPKRVWVLAALYWLASLGHSAHNAEFLVFYPNLPQEITRETVYLGWALMTAIGLVAGAFSVLGLGVLAGLCLGFYGALGTGVLAYYAQAHWSEYTLGANMTIWAQALLGAAVATAALTVAIRAVVRGPRRHRSLAARQHSSR